MPPVRHAHPSGGVHEPVELQLPDLPAESRCTQGGVVSDVVRVVALVSGHVQGVGYRWFVRAQAQAAGLTGSATNLPDGRVEAVAEGGAESLTRFEIALRRGPSRARVDQIEIDALPVSGHYLDFSID